MNILIPLAVLGALVMGSTASARRRRQGALGPSTPPSSEVFGTCPLEAHGLTSKVANNIRKYAGAAEAAALEQGIDPDLLMGQVMVESRWDPQAESGAGAVGMLQIMPNTGKWISEKSGLPNDRLDPVNNMRMGAWLIQYLYQKWDGNLDLALAAYFAGSGNVRKALDESGAVPASYANYANAVYERQTEFAQIREFCASEVF